MKNKKQQFKSTLTTLSLALVLAGSLALPGAAPEELNPAFPQITVEEEMPEGDDGIQPLSDDDRPTTKNEAVD